MSRAIRNYPGAGSFDREIAVSLRCNILPRFFRGCANHRRSDRLGLVPMHAVLLFAIPYLVDGRWCTHFNQKSGSTKPEAAYGSPKCYDDERGHGYACSASMVYTRDVYSAAWHSVAKGGKGAGKNGRPFARVIRKSNRDDLLLDFREYAYRSNGNGDLAAVT